MDSLESFEAVIASEAAARAVSGTNETIQASQELQQAAPIVAELAANPEVFYVQGFEIDAAAVQNVNTSLATPLVEVPAVVVDPSTGFFGAYVEPTIEKVEQAVVSEAEKVVEMFQYDVLEPAKEGYVAGEHLVRKAINVVLHGSHIKNPA